MSSLTSLPNEIILQIMHDVDALDQISKTCYRFNQCAKFIHQKRRRRKLEGFLQHHLQHRKLALSCRTHLYYIVDDQKSKFRHCAGDRTGFYTYDYDGNNFPVHRTCFRLWSDK
jgi:hypothetical protein